MMYTQLGSEALANRRRLRWSPSRRRMTTETLEQRLMLTAISQLEPAANSNTAPLDTHVQLTFDTPVNPQSVSNTSLYIVGEQSGRFELEPTAFTVTDDEVTVRLPGELHAGESVEVVATSQITSDANDPLSPSVWRWRGVVPKGVGQFARTASLGSSRSTDVAIADLSGDGRVDAVVAKTFAFETLFGDEQGLQPSGTFPTDDVFPVAVRLADLDGDDDTDVVIGGFGTDEIWLNDGQGGFTRGGALASVDTFDVVTGDLDGDGDIDVVTVGESGDFENATVDVSIWMNDGTANFTRVGLAEDQFTLGVALGDFDNDLDLDLVLVGDGIRTWFNQGDGTWQRGERSAGGFFTSVSLVDLDNDGDLDSFLIGEDPNSLAFGGTVWINDGTGRFDLGDFNAAELATDAVFGDVDADGDLDAVVSGAGFFGEAGVHAVWKNQGDGSFLPSPNNLSALPVTKSALADLDADGDLDVYAATEGEDEVWSNLDIPVDLKVTITNGRQGFQEGIESISYQVKVANEGTESTTAASVSTEFTNLGEVSWECESPATACTESGVGNLTDTIDLAAGGEVVYLVSGAPADPTTAVIASASVQLSEGALDLQPANNSNVDVDAPVQVAVTPARGSSSATNSPSLGVSRASSDLGGTEGVQIHVYGGQSGAATIVDAPRSTAKTIEFEASDFGAGELVQVTVGELVTTGNQLLQSQVWRFRTATTQGTGAFGREVPIPMAVFEATNVSIGDLNRDGHLDLFSFSTRDSNVWLNDGNGRFFDGGHNLARNLFAFESDAALGDFDIDGDLDVLVVTDQTSQLWQNNGRGHFIVTDTIDAVGSSVAVGDLDGDGDLDALVGGFEQTFVLENDGGVLGVTKPKRPIEVLGVDDTVLADVDGDGDLDAYLLFRFEGRGELWLNAGSGEFSFSGHSISTFSNSGRVWRH